MMKLLSLVVLVTLLAPVAAEPIAASVHLRTRLAEEMGLPEETPTQQVETPDIREIVSGRWDSQQSYGLGKAAGKRTIPAGAFLWGLLTGAIPFLGSGLGVLTVSSKAPRTVPEQVEVFSYVQGYRDGSRSTNRIGAAIPATLWCIFYFVVFSRV